MWLQIQKLQFLDESKSGDDEKPDKHKSGPISAEVLARIEALEKGKATIQIENVAYQNSNAIEELRKQLTSFIKKGNQDFDAASFQKRIQMLIDGKANKSDLDHTRTDFGMWFKKIREELANKLNREDL